MCTWDLILVKESQPLTPAVTAGWGTDDQFISPSLSLNERTSAILPFQSLIKTFKYWSARETLPLRESMPSVFPRALCPRAGYGLRHYWLSESYKVSVGSPSADEESGLTCICKMHRFLNIKRWWICAWNSSQGRYTEIGNSLPCCFWRSEFPAQYPWKPEWNKWPRSPVRCADSACLLWPGLQPLSPGHFLPGHLQERAAMDLLVTFPLRWSTPTRPPPLPPLHPPSPLGASEHDKSLGLPQGLLKPFGLFLTS